VIFRPCFHGALNWQVWQVGFLFVFSVQFDGEKPDKVTRGACACNDDKFIFENNPEFYFHEAGEVRTWASHSGAQWRTIVRVALPG
jgi:hypothetical protein